MAEVNQDLVQQLEANLASFEAAGLTDEAESVKKKLADVKGGKSPTVAAKTTQKSTSRKKA